MMTRLMAGFTAILLSFAAFGCSPPRPCCRQDCGQADCCKTDPKSAAREDVDAR